MGTVGWAELVRAWAGGDSQLVRMGQRESRNGIVGCMGGGGPDSRIGSVGQGRTRGRRALDSRDGPCAAWVVSSWCGKANVEQVGAVVGFGT